MQDLDYALRYPFSKLAKKTLDEKEVQLNETIVSQAADRVKKALKGEAGRSSAFHEIDKINEIASFAAARMLLSFMNNRFITNKFAVAESKRVSDYLDKEKEPTIIESVGKELGLVWHMDQGKILMQIPIYLKFSPRALPYKLINRELRNGNVVIVEREKIRLMEEAVRKRLERVPLLKDPPKLIEETAAKLIAELPKSDLPQIRINPGDYPPCIMKLMDDVKKHENLNHQARWFLCVYLMAAGMNDDQLTDIYSNLPDFSERTTRYQVEHARKKGYTVPACSTIMTWGFCCANCRIGSPIYWKGGSRQ